MEVFSVSKSNIDDFEFLFNDEAINGIKSEVSSGFVIKHDGRHVGGMYGEFVSSTDFAILCMYVLPEYRRQGVGSFMLDTLYDILKGMDISLDVRFAAIGEDGKALAEFLEAKGFDDYINGDDEIYYTTVEKIKDIKLSAKSKTIKYKSLSEMPSFALNELVNSATGFVPVPLDGFESKAVNKDLSYGMYNDGELCGYAICEILNDDNIMLSCLYIKKGVAAIALTGLLGVLVKVVQEEYPKTAGIAIPCINEDSKKLVEALFADEDIEMVAACYTKRLVPEVDYSDKELKDFLEDEKQYLYGDDEEGNYLTDVLPMSWVE